MIYINKLIYIVPGKESVFDEFEKVSIPIIARYDGELLLRTMPGRVLEATIEVPYEIQFVSFPSVEHYERYRYDEEREAHMHLKEEAVRRSFMLMSYEIRAVS
jgi:uncharacterized protein (DUF1330 family)